MKDYLTCKNQGLPVPSEMGIYSLILSISVKGYSIFRGLQI